MLITGDLHGNPERLQFIQNKKLATEDVILIETDAPFILPYCKDVLPPKLLRRARNTSLILPAVIEKIAQLKGIFAEIVEQATANNAIRLFQLANELAEYNF